MMFNKQVTATSFGYRYTFRLRNSGNLPKSLNPERFFDQGLALQFVRRLHLSDSHWQGFTHSVSSLNYDDWRNSNPWSGIEPYIAECLVRGDIQVFKHKISAVLKSDATKRQFKTKVGMSYQFVPASSLLTSQPNNTESITTEASAKELIKKLELTEPQLEELVDALELSKGTANTVESKDMNEALYEALVKDEVIVCVETPNSATKSSEYGGSEAASNTGFDDSPHPDAASNSDNSAVDGVEGEKRPNRDPRYRSDLDEKWFKANGDLDWPENDGFDGKSQRQTLQNREIIDRFSTKTGTKDRGNFLSPVNTPYNDRALPYDASKMKHVKYEVIKEFDVNSGKAASWFGENGGGIQYQTDMSVRDLIKEGFLREVK